MNKKTAPKPEERPPVFSRWKYWYWLLLGWLGLLILLFYLITWYFD